MWGMTPADYKAKADLWPLNPKGELYNFTIVESKAGLAKVREIAATPEMHQRMQSINVVVPPETPEQMLAYFEQDSAANAKLIRDAKITLN